MSGMRGWVYSYLLLLFHPFYSVGVNQRTQNTRNVLKLLAGAQREREREYTLLSNPAPALFFLPI